VEPPTGFEICLHVFVTIQTQVCFRVAVKETMATFAVGFDIGVALEDRSRGDEFFEIDSHADMDRANPHCIHHTEKRKNSFEFLQITMTPQAVQYIWTAIT
jgi:hypothetical protein